MKSSSNPVVLSDDRVNRYLQDRDYKLQILRWADDIISERDVPLTPEADPIAFHLSRRLAKGKPAVSSLNPKVKLGVVVPVWKETERLMPHSTTNPLGEDALRCKVDALRWLFTDTPVKWTIYVIDDNCPDASGEVARQIAAQEQYSEVVVSTLQGGFPYTEEPLSRLTSLAQSVKGGAVIKGLQMAVDDGCDYVLYCDCDNSSYVGQVGQLLATAHGRQLDFVGGSRHLDKVILDWSPDRVSEVEDGFKTIRYLRSFLQVKLPSNDTFGGFKLFRSTALAQILPSMSIFDFAFDMDLLGALSHIGASSDQEPIVSIDSHAASTWHHRGDHIVWYNKILSLMSVADKYGLSYNRELAKVIKRQLHGPDAVMRLIKLPAPPQLSDVSRVDVRSEGLMSVEEMEAFLARSLHISQIHV